MKRVRVFPGSRTNTSFYNEKLLRDNSLLPAAFGEIRGSADATDRFFTLQTQDYAHPIVALWNDPSAGSLATAHFNQSLKLTPGTADATRAAGAPLVVLRYADGEPALVEHTYGAGRVLQFSSTADSAWNDLCVRPLFVPLIHRCLGALIGRQDERLNLSVGTRFSSEMPADLAEKSARITRPGDAPEQGTATSIRIVDSTPTLSFAETDHAGAYAVRTGDDATPVMRFAVQSDPGESRLDSLSPAELKALESVVQITRSATGMNLRQALTDQRNGAELWLPLAWIVLGVAISETVLGNRWSRSK